MDEEAGEETDGCMHVASFKESAMVPLVPETRPINGELLSLQRPRERAQLPVPVPARRRRRPALSDASE